MVFYPTMMHCKATLTGLGTTWPNEVNFAMNLSPGAGSLAQPADLHSSALQLCYNCPRLIV